MACLQQVLTLQASMTVVSCIANVPSKRMQLMLRRSLPLLLPQSTLCLIVTRMSCLIPAEALDFCYDHHLSV